MQRIQAIITGALTGGVLGIIAPMLAGLTWLMLSGRPTDLSQAIGIVAAITTFSVANGMIIGGLSGIMAHEFGLGELSILGIMLSIAVGAFYVIVAGYENNSLLPVVIYAIAIVNGLLTPLVGGLVVLSAVADDSREVWR